MERKPLPVGIDDFAKLIENGCYYADKTLLIRDLLTNAGEVNLFTRPRRFGKTLNMSMLKYYFEDTMDDVENSRSRKLFEGTKILKEGPKITSRMCGSPVIMITLKSMKQADYNDAFLMAKRELAREYYRHRRVISSLELLTDQKRYENMMNSEGEEGDYLDGLRFLSDCLYQSYKKKVIILIDEYDVPLENAWMETTERPHERKGDLDFYSRMVRFLRSVFESALKSNPGLDFAVVTGCLRISKESIFTGLNNLEMISIMNSYYAEHFGFLETEVKEMLSYYNRDDYLDTMKMWYDGYRFGNVEVYNPWSVINYVKQIVRDPEAFPAPFWSNTSSNSIVRDLVERADNSSREIIEMLMEGGSLEIPVHEDVTYGDIYESEDSLWNFLFFTGYLKQISSRQDGSQIKVTLSIPNLEVRQIYENTITSWFQTCVRKKDYMPLYQALIDGDAKTVSDIISDELFDTISYYDGSNEAFYHGFMAGLLRGMEDYAVESNRESGNGRPDLTLRYKRIHGKGIVLEFKVAKTAGDMARKMNEAKKQIITGRYKEGLQEEGYQDVMAYAIVFYRKECMAGMI